MTKKLYVGNLSWGTTEEGLRQSFEQFGNVLEARVITDRDTGRSRGFGFVTLEDDDAADTAIQEMDGQELDGRPLRVNVANDRKPRDRGSSGGGGNRW